MLRVYSLAELRLAQVRPRESLEAALLVGEIGERTVRFLGYCPWRTTAAQAALLLGERDRALGLAEEELARAERTDVLHLRIRARPRGRLVLSREPAGHSQPARGGAVGRRRTAAPGDDTSAARPGRCPAAGESPHRGARPARPGGRHGQPRRRGRAA